MRVTQRMITDTVLANISRNTENMNKLQDQLSSGKKLRRASDDPASLQRALVLRSSKDHNTQYIRNITSARGWLEATDSALDQLTTVLTQAQNLALRGASTTYDDDELETMANQVESLMYEAQQVGNTTHEGKYIFSGRQISTLPFDITNNPVYQGDSGQINCEITRGVKVPINTLNGEITVSVTDAGGATSPRGVIEASIVVLDAIKTQLRNHQAVTSTQLDQLEQCLNGISELRGSVGARIQRLDSTENGITSSQTNIEASLSRAQDTDIAEVYTKLMTQESVYQAALAAGARVIQPSLLDFLT